MDQEYHDTAFINKQTPMGRWTPMIYQDVMELCQYWLSYPMFQIYSKVNVDLSRYRYSGIHPWVSEEENIQCKLIVFISHVTSYTHHHVPVSPTLLYFIAPRRCSNYKSAIFELIV